VATGKPFSLDYAKAHTDPALWDSAPFIRGNVLIPSVWSSVFTINTLLAWGKMKELLLAALGL
jgi:hypothetical protein